MMTKKDYKMLSKILHEIWKEYNLKISDKLDRKKHFKRLISRLCHEISVNYTNFDVRRFENAVYYDIKYLPQAPILERSGSPICPECGRRNTWRNSSCLLQCDNCGYEEEDNEQ